MDFLLRLFLILEVPLPAYGSISIGALRFPPASWPAEPDSLASISLLCFMSFLETRRPPFTVILSLQDRAVFSEHTPEISRAQKA
jgi:hypothetical protein